LIFHKFLAIATNEKNDVDKSLAKISSLKKGKNYISCKWGLDE
jgi:hypothetical protein